MNATRLYPTSRPQLIKRLLNEIKSGSSGPLFLTVQGSGRGSEEQQMQRECVSEVGITCCVDFIVRRRPDSGRLPRLRVNLWTVRGPGEGRHHAAVITC